MRRWLIGIILATVALAVSSPPAAAQTQVSSLTTQAANCGNPPANTTGGAFIAVGSAGGAAITLSGTWSGTISFFGSGNGGLTWDAIVSLNNSNVSTATNNGTWQFNPTAYGHICAAFTTASTGTVAVTIRLSTNSAGHGGGGGASGSSFSAITAGTNTNALVVGTGGSLTTSGTGTINANIVNGATTINPNLNVVYISSSCGVQANCFQAVTGDNATIFASAMSYANSLTTTASVIQQPHNAPQILQGNSAVQTQTLNASPIGKDTVYVFVPDSAGRTYTVSDTGGSSYTQIGTATNSGGGGYMNLFSTTAGGAIASNSITAATSGTANLFNIAAIDVAGATGQTAATPTTGSSTAPSISVTTTQAGSFVLASCVWYSGGTDALSSSAGTLLLNNGATVSLIGTAVWGTYQATIGTVVSSGTLGTTSPWACQAVEVKAGGTIAANPTIRIAQGFYNYSSGLSLTQASNIQGEGTTGTVLNYTGSAHAVDIGPSGLTSAQNSRPYLIQDLQFTGGSTMTEGVYLNKFATLVGIHDVWFNDFGNSSAYMIYGFCDNWDIEVGPQVRVIVDDYLPRPIAINNGGHCDNESFWRIHDVVAACWQGPSAVAGGCTAGQSTTGFVIDSAHSRFYHNNVAFWNPDIDVICSETPCFGNNIESNQLETVGAAGTGTALAPILYAAGVDQLLVNTNSVNLHSLTSFIAPLSGSDYITGSRVAWNNLSNIATSTPVVVENNLVTNVANSSFQNGCNVGTTVGSSLPCSIIHTAGGNISAWLTNIDPDGLSFTGATSGSTTIIAPAVAGSIGNSVAFVNDVSAPIVQMTTGTQYVTGADYTNATVTPSTVFSWTLPASTAAQNYRYSCDIMWESTAATLVGPVFGLNLSAAPTQLTGIASVQNTLAGADINGYLSNATTGSQTLVTSSAAGVTSTNYWAKISGTIEGAAVAGSTFIINAASTSGTTASLNIRRGSGCTLTAK